MKPKGLQAYSEYQLAHEQEILKPGSGFALVKALLKLNESSKKRRVEVLIMSRNSADTSLRIFTSIAHYGLDITRAVLSGGGPLTGYLKAFGVDLFLSANEEDVRSALAAGLRQDAFIPMRLRAMIRCRISLRSGLPLMVMPCCFQMRANRYFKRTVWRHSQSMKRHVPDRYCRRDPCAVSQDDCGPAEEFEGHAPIRTALVTARNARRMNG